MKHDNTYMNIAFEMADLSKCISHKVGCVIVKDNRIISTGVNGSPAGYRNCCDEFPLREHETGYFNFYTHKGEIEFEQEIFVPERHHEWSNLHEIHAEQNAIANAARHGISIEGADIYSTLKPCMHCSKLLIAAGIKTIIYRNEYKRHSFPEIDKMLEHCNVEVRQI